MPPPPFYTFSRILPVPTYAFPLIALGLMLLDWFAVSRRWKTVEYVAKPGVMVALLAWLWQADIAAPYNWLFGAGLCFSMIGDFFLILPGGFFMPGLTAFVFAQLAYMAGFTTSQPPGNPWGVVFAILIAVPAIWIYRRVSMELVRQERTELRIPVLIYTILISLMLFSASLAVLRPETEWRHIPAILVASGALLFYLSDSLLAWRLFVNPFPHDRTLGIVAYQLGQFAITFGVILNYGLA